MKTKLNILLVVLLIALPAHSEVKIISTKAWTPTITGSWTKDAGLTYNNTNYGDTYYNPNYQDMNKVSNLDYMSVTRYFYLRPDTKRTWMFSMPITNLNAEKGYSYYARNNQNLKQQAEQIYWGIIVGYKVDGISKTIKVWFKRSNREYYNGGYEAYGSSKYIEYNIDNAGWKKCTYMDYPSCSPSNAPKFRIETISFGITNMYWGEFSIGIYSGFIEELTYIKILVGTQANIQIGKPYAYGSAVKENEIYVAADYMEQENYTMVKHKLYKADGQYYEGQAINLAFAYAVLDETDKALELCNALIKYNGESIQYAYWLRGTIKEYKGQKISALDDYQKANDQDSYARLYNEIYKPKQNQQTPKQQNSGKPALTK